MKITIFINFAENILKNPIAITLDDSETLAALNKKRIKEYKTPYNRIYNSSAAMLLEYQHKDRVFTSSDLNESLRDLGLRNNDSINIHIPNINLAVMRAALTADLLATNVDDPRSYSTPLSIALIAQRHLRDIPWKKEELWQLKNHINFHHEIWLSNEEPTHVYNQLAPLSSMLNLLFFYLYAEENSCEVENSIDYFREYTEYYMQRFLHAAGDLATLNHVVEEWNTFPHIQSDYFSFLELILVKYFSFSLQATILIIGYLATSEQEKTLAKKPSLSDLMPINLQNAIEENNDILFKFIHTIDDQLLLFRNELRFLFKEKGIENSTVNLKLLSGKIIITNMNLAKLVEIDAIPIIPEVVKHALLVDLEETKPEEAFNPTPSSLTLIAQRQQSKKPWTGKEIAALQYNLTEICNRRPNDSPKLFPQYAMLNLLHSQAENGKEIIGHYFSENMFKLSNALNKSKVDFGKIQRILSNSTFINFPSDIKLKERCWTTLAKALQNNKTITAFRLSETSAKIDTQAITALANTLQWNTTLKILELESKKIEDGQITMLVRGLENNKTLLSLNIKGRSIGKKDTEALANLLRTSTTLRSVELNFLLSDLLDEKSLIAAGKDSTTLENFNFNNVVIFKNKQSVQLTSRQEYTTYCMLSIFKNDFKNSTDVIEKSGHLNFQLVNLDLLAQIIIDLGLFPTVLVELIKEYLEGNTTLTPLPMTKEVFAKKPSLAELTKNAVLNIKKVEKNVVITFTLDTSMDQKLSLRNGLMDLFREKQMNSIVDVSYTTGALTISNMTIERLEELNIIPRSHHSRCIIT